MSLFKTWTPVTFVYAMHYKIKSQVKLQTEDLWQCVPAYHGRAPCTFNLWKYNSRILKQGTQAGIIYNT